MNDHQFLLNTGANNTTVKSNIPFDKDIYLNPQLTLAVPNNDDLFVSPHSSISSVSRDSLLSNNTLQHTQSLNQNQYNSNFTLPLELQGGVNNIFNRRPSYAADLHSNSSSNENSAGNNLKHFPLQFNHVNNQRNEIYDLRNTGKNSDCSPLSSFNPAPRLPNSSSTSNSNSNSNPNSRSNSEFDTSYISLDDGLLLNKANNTIVISPELKRQFDQCSIYFGDFYAATQVVNQLDNLLGLSSNQDLQEDPTSKVQLSIIRRRIDKLLEFLLKQNEDLKSPNHLNNKNYSLILNKNGRLDIISFPKNSNLHLMPKDLIIIEGDRGKDLVMVLKPVIDFKFALFFNYLKKKLHLKSLEFGNSSSNRNQSNPSSSSSSAPPSRHSNHNNNNNNAFHQKSIINEDENFITLPNKQILRFAKPHELNQLILKYNDEIMAYKICLNYSASLNLDLIIKNVEFQFDKKKLIIYYYCLQRLDFRGLIKELFKIYKTRIWLCAILPLEKTFKPLLDYELEKIDMKIENSSNSSDQNSAKGQNCNKNGQENQLYRSNANVVHDNFPSSDQIYQFSEIEEPIYFHCKIFSNLINMFQFEISNYEVFKDRYWFLDEQQAQ